MRLYNTLSRSVEDFTPIQDNTVKLYTCGLTVYSQPHIGNWVAYIYWDILVRTLRASGYGVERVQNITDVGHLTSDEDAGEDKMLKGAMREGLTAWQVADKYIAVADHEAFGMLGLIRPEHLPRATDYIEQQKDFVEQLSASGFTYTIEDGVYFDTHTFEQYGQMAHLDIEGLEFGSRVADTGKKNPTDFAVWKFSAPGERRDMEWDSPLGIERKGFPGWHLECSVMAREILGDRLDIHTGGIDHIPVHHTNEIAQTEAITGKRFSNFWVHANHIKVDGKKMSKSLGNIYTLQDLIDRGYDVDAFKVLVLSKHYRTEGNFSWEILTAASNRLAHWREMAVLMYQLTDKETLAQDIMRAPDDIRSCLTDDLDTPRSLTVIDRLADTVTTRLSARQAEELRDVLIGIDTLLGLHLSTIPDIDDASRDLIRIRDEARAEKDWAKSDQIRDELSEKGIGVRDTPHGTAWFWQ